MNKNFFTATEAKERSVAISSGKLEEELEHIYEEINKAISLGKTEVILYNTSISAQAQDFLFNKGFKVSWFGGDPRDPYNDTTISWE